MRYVDRYLRLSIWTEFMDSPITFNVDWKIVFRIKKHASVDFLSFNTAEISVYNMNSTLRKYLSNKNMRISLVAGYVKLKDTIFEGVINNVVTVKQGPDLITTFYCSSNTAAYSYPVQKCVQNVSVTTLISNLCKEYNVPYVLPFTKSDIVTKSYTGTFAKVLALICKEYNISCGIDNGTLIFKDKSVDIEDIKDTESTTLTPTSGLLGNPVVNDRGVNVKTLLNPHLKVNDYFTLYAPYAEYNLDALTTTTDKVLGDKLNAFAYIDTKNYNGTYMILSIVVSGDTKGNTWYTDIEGSRIWPKNARVYVQS